MVPELTVKKVARVEIHTTLVDSVERVSIHVFDADGQYLIKINLKASERIYWPIHFDSDRS